MYAMYPTQRGDCPIVDYLWEKEALVNQQWLSSGIGALMLVAAANHLDIIKNLIEAGAEVNQTQWRWQSSFDYYSQNIKNI